MGLQLVPAKAKPSKHCCQHHLTHFRLARNSSGPCYSSGSGMPFVTRIATIIWTFWLAYKYCFLGWSDAQIWHYWRISWLTRSHWCIVVTDSNKWWCAWGSLHQGNPSKYGWACYRGKECAWRHGWDWRQGSLLTCQSWLTIFWSWEQASSLMKMSSTLMITAYQASSTLFGYF